MQEKSAAQEEFDRFISKNRGATGTDRLHPEDRREAVSGEGDSLNDHAEQNEEERHRQSRIDAAMRMPAFGSSSAPLGSGAADIDIKLPPTSFDSGRATGVKGVIADARNYEIARRTNFMSRVRQARRSVFGIDGNGHGSTHNHYHHHNHNHNSSIHKSDSGDSGDDNGRDPEDEEGFLQQWRESRRRELEDEASRGVIRTRRTSPSVRMFGRLDQVDALGYLDAIEKVGRETVVAVFVYDDECQVSATVESALMPLVRTYPMVHFVKVHYDDIEFDNAAVPAVLAYKNQGDLFANLTGIIEMIPDNEEFASDSLKRIFARHGII